MHDHSLKEYQQETLTALARFCDEVRLSVAGQMRRPLHDAFQTATGREFNAVPQMPGVPYVCLRVPTGGGKTLIAAHAVGVVAKRLGQQEYPLCLWVTPSTTIRDQTLLGLQTRGHPYRTALKESLGVPLEVMTLEEALSANASKTNAAALIVVTTIQSYRIDDEENRRIYQDNGYLMDHFQGLPVGVRAQLDPNEHGRVPFSFANVMKLLQPIVIMDEAHNARTQTSFDSLARMGPLAVLEFTATPILRHNPPEDYASNVLHAVSALQLHREGMIKLPIDLESREDWLDVLALTVQKRAALAERAAAWGRTSGRFIRPIALIQAQPRSKNKETHTVDRVKESLIQHLQVPADRIRIATGDNDELGDEDLMKPECTVEYIITVDKLREGWDCPFAYVLGSVGNVATETAVEQLLGRILRMPHTTPTDVPELNRAYAIVQSKEVQRVALRLADSLVLRLGFDKEFAPEVFRVHRQQDFTPSLIFSSIPVTAPPDLSILAPEVQKKVQYEPDTGTITVRAPLTRDEAQELRDALPSPTDKAAVENYWQEEREVGTVSKMLDQYAKPIRVPQLAISNGQQFIRFDPIELDEFDWNLNKCDPRVTEGEFSGELHVGDHVLIDVSKQGAVRIGSVEGVVIDRPALFAIDDKWTKAELVRWLDRELHRAGRNAGLTAADSQPWLNRVVDYLLGERNMNIPVLVRKRHDLVNQLDQRIMEHGRQQVRIAAQALFADTGPRRLVTTFDLACVLDEERYLPYGTYGGPFAFRNHAFVKVGRMGDEESQCARMLDNHANVKRWIRNLEHESAGGFSLPLSPGRFFPDFLAELKDGRTAIVEYKGKQRAELSEERHKQTVGELWQARADGRCVFAWVVDRDWATLNARLQPA